MVTGRTVAERRELVTQLSNMFNRWRHMTDGELFNEVKKSCPACVSANREECIKYLTMSHVNLMIGSKY